MWESSYQIVPTRWWVEASGALVDEKDWEEEIGVSLKKVGAFECFGLNTGLTGRV